MTKDTEQKQREERDIAKHYLDLAGVMLVVINARQEVTLINKKGCEILGCEENEILGSSWFDTFIPEQIREEIRSSFIQHVSGKGEIIQKHETAVITKSGQERIIEWHHRVLRDHKEAVTGTLSTGNDITAFRRAEEKTERIQQDHMAKHNDLNDLFRKVEIANKERQKIMDAVGDMIILTDEEGKIKRVNRAARDFSDTSYIALIGKDWEEFIYENDLEAMTLFLGSTELYHKPTEKWFLLKTYPFEDTDLNISGTVITLHESTEIKHISEKLEESNITINEYKDKLERALNQISTLMQNVINNTDTSIRLDNDNLGKCYEVMNCTKEDCICFGREAMRCWQAAGTYCGGKVQGAFAQKYGNCAECRVFKIATTDPIYQIGEQYNNMMHILEIKNQELKNANKELKATQSTVLQQEKMASIGQLAAGVAHEINNPTGFITSNLGTLEKYVSKLTEFINFQTSEIASLSTSEKIELMKKQRSKLKVDYILNDVGDLVKESLDGADRIKKIVQNLKSFSRIDDSENQSADINECIESTLNIVWNELKYKTTVKKEYGDLPHAICNPQQINQVFMNLLVNAAQAIETQGEILIKTWNGGGSVHISITDTGCGIPQDKISKIFEPFYTSKEVGQGTGLGLSIAYDIVKKHNGEILITSEPGKGTTFKVTLPSES